MSPVFIWANPYPNDLATSTKNHHATSLLDSMVGLSRWWFGFEGQIHLRTWIDFIMTRMPILPIGISSELAVSRIYCSTSILVQLKMICSFDTTLLRYRFDSPWSTAKSGQILFAIVFGGYLLYWSFRAIYRIRFHPLAKYPGSSVAAISTEW